MDTLKLTSYAEAARSVAAFDLYLPMQTETINRDTLRPFAGAVDANLYFEALGDQASRYWTSHGRRIDAHMQLLAAEQMVAGMSQSDAVQAAWDAMAKPSVICAHVGGGRMRATSVSFPTETPLAVWALTVADEAALEALVAEGDAAVHAALLAAQPES